MVVGRVLARILVEQGADWKCWGALWGGAAVFIPLGDRYQLYRLMHAQQMAEEYRWRRTPRKSLHKASLRLGRLAFNARLCITPGTF